MSRTREPLTASRVFDAGVALADAHGIEAVSMRRLGEELGVEAMSLYHHVANKDAVLDGMIDRVMAGYDLDPPDGDDWRGAARHIARSARDVLVSHPWAASLMITHVGDPGANRLRYMERLLEVLRTAGFDEELTHHGYHALDIHISGYAYQQVSFPVEASDLADIGSDFLAQLPVDRFPYLAEHIKGHIDGVFDERSGFEFSLDLLLDGLERLRDR